VLNSHDAVDLIGHLAIMATALVTLIVALRRSHHHDDTDDR